MESVPKAGPDHIQARATFVLAHMVAVSSLKLESLATVDTPKMGFFHALVDRHVLLQEVPVHKTVGTNRAGKNRDA